MFLHLAHLGVLRFFLCVFKNQTPDRCSPFSAVKRSRPHPPPPFLKQACMEREGNALAGPVVSQAFVSALKTRHGMRHLQTVCLGKYALEFQWQMNLSGEEMRLWAKRTRRRERTALFSLGFEYEVCLNRQQKNGSSFCHSIRGNGRWKELKEVCCLEEHGNHDTFTFVVFGRIAVAGPLSGTVWASGWVVSHCIPCAPLVDRFALFLGGCRELWFRNIFIMYFYQKQLDSLVWLSFVRASISPKDYIFAKDLMFVSRCTCYSSKPNIHF